VFNNRLYVAFQANDASNILYVAEASDGQTFTAHGIGDIEIGNPELELIKQFTALGAQIFALASSDTWENVKQYFKDNWLDILKQSEDEDKDDAPDRWADAWRSGMDYYEQRVTIDKLQKDLDAANKALQEAKDEALKQWAEGNKGEKDPHDAGGTWAGPDAKDEGGDKIV
jgi:hypothetical protein